MLVFIIIRLEQFGIYMTMNFRRVEDTLFFCEDDTFLLMCKGNEEKEE